MKVNDKQEQILSAAIRRLSRFGVHKTTLTEIAEDVHMSKQSLMYYFPDKQHLVACVINNIAAEYMQEIGKVTAQDDDLTSVFENLIDMRHRFFSKYYLLFVQMELDGLGKEDEILHAIAEAKKNETQLLAKKVEQAMARGEASTGDPLHTVQLLLETLTAYAKCMHNHQPVPEEKDVETLCEKQKEVIRMMINGIKA